MKALKKLWIVILAVMMTATCLVGCNVRYEGVYELYSITREVNGEEIVYEIGDVYVRPNGESITLTKESLVYTLKAPKDQKGKFTVTGEIYSYSGGGATGVWEKSKDKQLKLTVATNDGNNDTEEWWLVSCNGKTMSYEWEGVTLTLKK